MEYGARAKDWITDHDVKQKTLAKEFGITEAMMSNYLTGRTGISVDVLVKIARYFDLSMDYLVGLTDQPQRPLELSPAERGLVEGFRSLSGEQQVLFVKFLRLLQEQQGQP